MSSEAATSVSQFGITWTFSADRPVGQFANGDWWVVGPVTVVHISPNDPTPTDSTQIHGTMINPQYNTTGKPNWNGIQGWDSRIRDSTYVSSLNIGRSLPYTIQNAASVMTCKSILETAIGNNVQMDTVAILTVLPSAPPANSFRPPYIGTDKTVRWNKSQLDYTKLKSLPVVANTPPLAEVESYFEKAHIALGPSWSGTYLHPKSNDYPGYGREISHKAGAGALSLNLNYTAAQKEKLLVRMVQRGIDIYGVQAAGGGWWPDGGHNHGRKFPMILAGTLLGDSNILSRANGSFAEDGQHFYVSMIDVTRLRKAGREPYTSSMIGTPEWGGNHLGQPEGDGSQWSVPYRTLVGVSNMGPILAARIMGIQNQWNHPATFAYMDRFYSVEAGNVSTGTNSIQPFVSSMWKAYRNNLGGPTTTPPPVVASFKVGDRIAVASNTNVRQSGSLAGTLLGTQMSGATGTITSGPVNSDNLTWWQVNYDTNIDGWSASTNFVTSTTSPPTPPETPVMAVQIGSRVELTANTNVRLTGSLSGTLLGTQVTGSTGTVLAGPVEAENITWWQMDYDSGVDGWSGANNFIGSDTTAPPPPITTVGFKIGDRVQVTLNTNVRQSGTLSGILLGTQAAGSTGAIIGGPILSNNITWWQMNYDTGIDGWSGSDNFVSSNTSAPVPTSPVTGFKVGDRVQLVLNTNVRQTGSLSATLLGTQLAGASGEIIGGPVMADGITWWQMNYDAGIDGWSGSNNFTTPNSTSGSTVGGFKIGDRVQLGATTNVRQSGAYSGTLLGIQAVGALGQITGGPITSDNIIWWQMNYDTGVDGWSGANNFLASTSVATTRITSTAVLNEPVEASSSDPELLPSPPSGLRILPDN